MRISERASQVMVGGGEGVGLVLSLVELELKLRTSNFFEGPGGRPNIPMGIS